MEKFKLFVLLCFSILVFFVNPVQAIDKEIIEMQNLIQKEGNNFQLEAWDWWYYSEKLRQEQFQ